MTCRDEPTDPTVMARAAFDVLVFAPLGLGVKLVEDAPGAVGRARRELSNARFLGRLAVGQGLEQVRARIDTSRSAAVATPAPRGGSDPFPVAAEPPPATAEARDHASPGGSDEVLSADDLALPDYDTLPAIDIVAKLDTLDADDRAAIGHYEAVHRQRRTVLGKLAQLDDR
jgi:hypothetical protein